MTEIFSTIWVWIVSALGGLTLAGIITAIIYGVLKGAFAKTINKINVEKIADKATEKGIQRVKKISFTQNIQPLVESELRKIYEENVKFVTEQLKETQNNYLQMIDVFEKFANYFNNSYVDEKIKIEFKEAINKAKGNFDKKEIESVVVDEFVAEPIKEPKNDKIEVKKNVSVQR